MPRLRAHRVSTQDSRSNDLLSHSDTVVRKRPGDSPEWNYHPTIRVKEGTDLVALLRESNDCGGDNDLDHE